MIYSIEKIEFFIFEAWEHGYTGQTVIDYVCAMAQAPENVVVPILQNLINTLTEE